MGLDSLVARKMGLDPNRLQSVWYGDTAKLTLFKLEAVRLRFLAEGFVADILFGELSRNIDLHWCFFALG
jgi:hypothetical protein